MKYYTFLNESIENNSIKNIVKKSILDACQQRTIIEAKIVLGRGYQKSITLLALKVPNNEDIKYLNILEHAYLTIGKYPNSWKNYLETILKDIS